MVGLWFGFRGFFGLGFDGKPVALDTSGSGVLKGWSPEPLMSDLQGFLFQRWPSAVILVADVALRGTGDFLSRLIIRR